MQKPSLDPVVIQVSYPGSFAPGGDLYNQFAAPEAERLIAPFKGDVADALGELDFIAPKGGDSVACFGPSGRLHALKIERLPDWAKPHKDKIRHGEHLGVSHYIYNPEAQQWYLTAAHGRGRYKASYRPYASTDEADRKLAELKEAIEDGTYLNLKTKDLVSASAHAQSLAAIEIVEGQMKAWIAEEKQRRDTARRQSKREKLARSGAGALLYD